jgi:hypothetical protein
LAIFTLSRFKASVNRKNRLTWETEHTWYPPAQSFDFWKTWQKRGHGMAKKAQSSQSQSSSGPARKKTASKEKEQSARPLNRKGGRRFAKTRAFEALGGYHVIPHP